MYCEATGRTKGKAMGFIEQDKERITRLHDKYLTPVHSRGVVQSTVFQQESVNDYKIHSIDRLSVCPQLESIKVSNIIIKILQRLVINISNYNC